MSSYDFMRIFWPLELPWQETPGLLVGWRNSELDIFVVAVIDNLDSKGVDHALRNGSLFKKSQHSLSRIFQLSGRSRLHVLGTLNSTSSRTFDARHIQAFADGSSERPRVFCPPESGVVMQVIMFETPLPRWMQYMSLDPISLALEDKTLGIDGKEQLQESVLQARKLEEKIRLHSVRKHRATMKEESLGCIIGQINCSYEVSMLLKENAGHVLSRSKRSMSVSERVVESATSIWQQILSYLWEHIKKLFPFVSYFLIGLLVVQRAAAEVVLRIVEWRLKPDFAALKDISATAQQCDIRLQQLCYWPTQYLKLRKRKEDWESVTTAHPDYIRFYNSLWLVANDVIIGIAIGSYLIENSVSVATWIDALLRAYTIDGLHETITWLRNKPAGLKLNSELAFFLGDLFIWVVDYWAGCMANVRPHLPTVVLTIGFSSFAGASMPISLFSDLLSLLTLHIYSFYIASARIYNWQLTTIISLFHLFRGKKRNVLRNRIDSCDYDLDQLLIGTIVFTLLFFLLPTVLVYYLTFACARMVIIAIKAGLETCLACLNHFPLFALMLRVKDSKRLPGGIRFQLLEGVGEEDAAISYVHLKSIPLSFRAMFHQYFQLGNRIRKHYVSPHVILCLMTGRFVPPIHRKILYSLQYSMLPAHRGNVMDVYMKGSEEIVEGSRQQPTRTRSGRKHGSS